MRRTEEPNSEAGQTAPGILRVHLSKASARDLTKECRRNQKPLGSRNNVRGACRFFGASPSHRPWISARARPLADRLQTTTRRKRLTRLVTFLRDPTTPVSVTLLNDLTGGSGASILTAAVRSSPRYGIRSRGRCVSFPAARGSRKNRRARPERWGGCCRARSWM